jgi:SAM-dependent methyltransferase
MERARSFGAAADAYALGRPSYPAEAVRFVLPRVPCDVADVGAGTGKLTEALVALGCSVVAVEPDDVMRARIARADARAGAAEDLPLEDASVDAVVSGQAFHWFEPERFADEAVRVLRPGGTIGMLWNELDDRDETGAEFARIVGIGPATLSQADSSPPLHDPRLDAGRVAAEAHVQRLDVEKAVALAASYSPTILLPAAEREALLAELAEWVRGRGEIELAYVTHAWRYRLR